MNQERLENEFVRLLEINCPSTQEKPLADYLTGYFRDLGLNLIEKASISQSKCNLFITIPAYQSAYEGAILLSAHLDTIEPTDSIQIKRSNDRIASDGSTILGADDKSGIAIIQEVVTSLLEDKLPHPAIEIAFSVEEEIHLLGSKDFPIELITAKRGIVLDSDGDAGIITHSAPSHFSFEATIKGIPAHAGMEPEKGRSAILLASKLIQTLPFGRIDPETTSNIGIIRGGKATNIVAEECFLNGEVRSRNEAKLQLVSSYITSVFNRSNTDGYQVDFRSHKPYTAYHLDPDSEFIQQLKKSAESIGLQPTVVGSGGGSDANIYNERITNMQCVVLSCGMMKAHTHAEYIDLSNLYKTTQWLLRYFTDIASGK
jgi:tripeptide aminopeptidase